MHANVRYCFWGACLFSSVLVVVVIRFLSSWTASRPSISRLVMDLVSRNSRPKAEPDRSCRPCCCASGFSGLSSSSSLRSIYSAGFLKCTKRARLARPNQTPKKPSPSALMINRDGQKTLKKEKVTMKKVQNAF